MDIQSIRLKVTAVNRGIDKDISRPIGEWSIRRFL